jgi:hypothetical protein
MVQKRKNLCALVVGAVEVQGEAVAASQVESIRQALPDGESPPDFYRPLRLYADRLVGKCDLMAGADSKHHEAAADSAKLLQASEEAMAVVKANILGLRGFCIGIVGEDSLRELALDYNVAQDPKRVLTQGQMVYDRFYKPDLELLPIRLIKEPVDPKVLVEDLGKSNTILDLAVKAHVKQRKVVDTAYVLKKQTMKEFNVEFGPTAQYFEATFRVAGHTELADRIRPTVRQLQREEDGEDAGEEPTATPPPESTPTKLVTAASPEEVPVASTS